MLRLAVGIGVAGLIGALASSTPITGPAAPPAPRTVTLRYGPISLAAYETQRASNAVRTPRLDGYLTAMHARVVDAAGREVPKTRVMLHHVLFLNLGRFSAEEDQALALPGGYGYRLQAGDRWRMGWMLMNHAAAAESVYIEYRVTVLPGPALRPVTPFWSSAMCNRDRIYNVAGAGGINRRVWTWTAPFDGRIVAGEAHAHGGALDVTLSQPRCGDRPLLTSDARYSPDDPIYGLSPLLHEPSPNSMSLVSSAQGWPVRHGEKLRLTARYDARRPHVKVMAIMHLYAARGPAPAGCGALPADVQVSRLGFLGAPGVAVPPEVDVDLSSRAADGHAVVVDGVPGAEQAGQGDSTVLERGFTFSPRKLSVPRGARVTWRFADATAHDITLASGPRGFASQYLTRGGSYTRRLTVPGEYRLFCSLHPVDMPQVITVR
jgi:plastocyanin